MAQLFSARWWIVRWVGTILFATEAIVFAHADELTVRDAFVRMTDSGRKIDLGNAALAMGLRFEAGALQLTSFRNRLRTGAEDYVDEGSAAAVFLEKPAGARGTEVLWSKTVREGEVADPADDLREVRVEAGDLIGFGVNALGDPKGDSTRWISQIRYVDGQHYVSTDDATLAQGPEWFYYAYKQGTPYLEELDAIESVDLQRLRSDAGHLIESVAPVQSDPAAERIRVTSTYTSWTPDMAFTPLVNAVRLHPSGERSAMRGWRAPRAGTIQVGGAAQSSGGTVELEIVRYREDASSMTTSLRETRAEWRFDGSEAREVKVGGRAALELQVRMSRAGVRAEFHVVVFPGASVVRHWVSFENTTELPVRLKLDEHFAFRLPDESFTQYWIFGGTGRENSGLMQQASVRPSYHRALLGYMTDFYAPWMALQRSGGRDGWFISPEYHIRWILSVDRGPSGGPTVSATMPDLADHELSAGERITLPTVTLGVFDHSLDDMARRIYDWQYEYLWDFTREEWHARIPILANWYNDVHNLQENFAGRLADLDLTTADVMRTTGAEMLWHDAGWSESPNIWAPTRNGPDFAQTNRHLAKSGMNLVVWFAGVPSEGMMDAKVGSWGDFQWRTDGYIAREAWSAQGMIKQVERFLLKHPRSSFHTCAGGGRFAHTFDWQRYASLNFLTDSGGGPQTNYYFSYFETPDKWTDIVPIMSGTYRSATARQVLTAVPCWHLTFDPERKADDFEQARRMFEIYRFLRSEGVAGRWSYVAHPAVKGDEEYFYFQRLSRDRKRSCVILKHRAPGPVTIYPRELLPEWNYVVGFDSSRQTHVRTGRDLMENGIEIVDQVPGEIIYLGLPDRPGSGTDALPPSAPGTVFTRRETNLGHGGVGVYWSPGSDDRFVSYHEILRDGQVLGKASAGTYYFDHGSGWSAESRYEVRAVDGDGNVSPATTAKRLKDTPLTFSALGGHFRVAGREGWSAETWSEARGLEPMVFVPPVADPGGDHHGTGNQQGGVEGYWEGGGTARVGRGWQQASTDAQCIRTWDAPRRGHVRVLGRAAKEHYRSDQGSVLQIRILNNDTQVWPAVGWHDVPVGDAFGVPHDLRLSVQEGDSVRFVLNRAAEPENDIIAWMPRITYEEFDAANDEAPSKPVRILAGSNRSYTDSQGNVWSADRFFFGGRAMERGRIAASVSAARDDSALYEKGRAGADFGYSIPVEPGLYAVRLLFAETVHEAAGERPFDVSINGRKVMGNFDVFEAARGARRAYARVFRYVVPDADGRLVLRFMRGAGPLQASEEAMVQAIEILPENKAWVRIDVGAENQHIDWSGNVWASDHGHDGGRVLSSTAPVDQATPTLSDQRIYQTARSGRELTYRVAVPDGLYAVRLKFAELWRSEPGQRPMDIHINGRLFWSKWDPREAAGKEGMAIDLRADDITPGRDGLIAIRITAAAEADAILQGLEIE